MNKRDYTGLAMHLANRFYKFLLKYHRKDTVSLCKNINFIIAGKMETQEASRLIQRHLYRLARQLGYYKDKKDKYRWKKREKRLSSAGIEGRNW